MDRSTQIPQGRHAVKVKATPRLIKRDTNPDDSSVGIATRYGPDSPAIESRLGGEIFCTRPDLPWDPPSLLYNGYRVFPGGKEAGAWCWPPTPCSAEVEGRVELYLCSSSGPSWPVIGWTEQPQTWAADETQLLTFLNSALYTYGPRTPPPYLPWVNESLVPIACDSAGAKS